MRMLTIAAFALLASAGAALAQPAFPDGDVQRGHDLFMSSGCFQCHGTVGQGGAAGVRLAPLPKSAAAIAAYIRHPTLVMPPYTAQVLNDQAVADIHAYLVSIKPPPPVADIPLLKQLAP